MDGLPVELVRLVFGHCDPSSVRNLRAVSRLYAQVGYEYLVSPTFNSVGWGLDIDRLYNLAHHDRLNPYIERVILNFSELDEYYARHATYFKHFTDDREELAHHMSNALLQYQALSTVTAVQGPISNRYSRLGQALSELPNLTELLVSFTQCPWDNQYLRELWELPSCVKLDHKRAATYLNAVISALRDVRLQRLKIDWFPLEIMRQPDHRRHWFQFESSLGSLRSFSLVIDPEMTSDNPRTHFVALNGLGRILRVCKNLQSLSLAFRNGRRPRRRTYLSFGEMLDDFVFAQLEDVALEGISCQEGDLSDFLARHAPTLRRLRLGGPGLRKQEDHSLGGMHLCRGEWRRLFRSLQKGMKRKLHQLHLEGEFTSIHHESPRHERYLFHPTTDAEWRNIDATWRQAFDSRSSVEFERFVITGGEYPGTRVGA